MEKEKRQKALHRRVSIAGVVMALLVTVYSVYAFQAWMLTPTPAEVATTTNTTKSMEQAIPTEILLTCQNDCRSQAIDYCNSECRFAHQEMPRPTIFRACQAPCIKMAQNMCDLGSNEKDFIRKQCRTSGDAQAFKECQAYENELPRPRIQQVCKVGTRGAVSNSCKTISKCINDKVALWEKSNVHEL